MKLRVLVLVFSIVSPELLAMQLRYEKQNLLMLILFFLLLFLTYYFKSLIFPFRLQTQAINNVLAYWLSHASKLFLLLLNILKASGSYGMAPQCRRSSSAALFRRMTQVNIASVLNRLIHIEKLSFFR